MGTSFGSKPADKFVGVWSNGDTVRMRIWKNGHIDYKKQKEGARIQLSMSASYDEDGFTATMCCCCTALDGTYDDRRGPKPVFIVNKDVLVKVPLPNFGLLNLPFSTTLMTV